MKYPIITKGIDTFFIEKNHNGMYEIMKHDGNAKMVTNAYLFNEVLLWDNIEPFASGIKAYKYMKENFEKLL